MCPSCFLKCLSVCTVGMVPFLSQVRNIKWQFNELTTTTPPFDKSLSFDKIESDLTGSLGQILFGIRCIRLPGWKLLHGYGILQSTVSVGA